MSDWSDGFDLSSLFSNYDPNLDTGIGGAYDPNLDPSIPGGYDPNLDPNLPPGQYDPRLDPGVPSPGNSYGGGGSVTMAPGGGGSSSAMQSLIRALTGSNGGGSGMGALSALLPFLAMGAGGILSRNATNSATHQIQDSLANANTQVNSILGGASGMYKPYQDAGLQGLAGMQAFPKSNLAGNFSPIGSGKGINLSALAKGK